MRIPRLPIARRLRVLVAWGALCLLLAPSAFAYLRPIPGMSMEALVRDADVVVLGTAIDSRERSFPPPNRNTVSMVTVRIAETLKGTPPAGGTIIFGCYGTVAEWRGQERVYFIKTPRRFMANRGFSAEEAAFWQSAGWVLDNFTGANPAALSAELGRYNALYTADLEPLLTRDDILRAARREAALPEGEYHGQLEIYLRGQSPFFKQPDPERAIYGLVIPIDRRAEARARQWATSPEPFDRWNAVQVLNKFDSPENRRLLARLLQDPFVAPVEYWPDWGGFVMVNAMGRGKWAGKPYPMRREAFAALLGWRAAPAEAVLSQPAYPPAYPRPWVPAAVGGAVAALLFAVLLRGLFRRRRPDGTPRHRLFAGAGGVCLVLLLACVALWVRGHWRVDELAWRTDGGFRYELASLNGTLRLLRFDRVGEITPRLVWTSAPRTDQAVADWSLAQVGTAPPPLKTVGRWGFEAQTGQTWGMTGQIRLSAWTLPLWGPCALLALWPVARFGLYLRRRSRRQEGLCSHCGYDLRATPDRCPECGHVPAGT